MILDAHAHRVDEYREQYGALKVAMIDDQFESTPHRPQTGATYIRTKHGVNTS